MRVHRVKTNLTVVFISIVMCFLFGCAFSPQKVMLEPTLKLSETNIGKGAQVSLDVVDERDDTSIGHRGTVYGKAAKISSNQDITQVFSDAITKGLKRNGFFPVNSSDNSARQLKVQIRLIRYETSTGFWTGGVHTKAAIKVIASNNNKTYENLYRVENEKRVLFVPDGKENNRLINDIVSEVINELFNDQKLMSFLTE